MAPIPGDVWRLAMVIASGAFLSGLDASVVNVGLDTVTHSLNTDLATAQWVANGYLIALAASLPLCGWLSRRVGVGRLWLACLAAFTLASGACALAGGIGWLVGLRVVQGLAAGLLIPAGQTILGRAVGPERLGRVMATLGIAVTLAPALGPVVGGIVVHFGSWPWLFLVNLPVGVVAFALAVRLVPPGEAEPAGRLDWLGLVLVSAGLPLVVYGCTRWGEYGWSAAAGPLGGGLLSLAVFVGYALRRKNPILNLRLYARPAYAAASVTIGFVGAALFGAGLVYPLYFQVGRGADPLTAGLLLISLSVGTVVALPFSGRLVDRYGGGLVSVVGGVGTVLTTLPFALLDVGVAEWVVQALLVLRGAALACIAVPATTSAYQAVTAAQLPDAATQVNILTRVGGALGGAVFAVVLAAQLPAGVDPAFHRVFWLLTAASVLGLVGAVWLARQERKQPVSVGRPTPPALRPEGRPAR
jgi:EmrB/QacA subfamily drug resistance transporter